MTTSQTQERKLTKVEIALITLATYLEDPVHSDYKIKQHILEILELEEVNVLEV